MSPTNRDRDSGEFRLDPNADLWSSAPSPECPDPAIPEGEFTDLSLALGAAEHPEDLSERDHLALLEGVLGFSLGDERPAGALTVATDVAPCSSQLADLELGRLRAEPTPNARDSTREAPIGAAESLDAQRLARALDGKERHPLADLAFELREAYRPESLSPASAKGALAALDVRPPSAGNVTQLAPERESPPRNRGPWLWTTGTALALAAAWALIWRSGSELTPREDATAPQLALSRSAEPLLQSTHWQGGSTERIDRIAVARSRELRQNRYLRWRVR